MNNFELILFDLGNTIFYIDFDLTYAHWARSSGLSVEEVKKRYVFDEIHKQFERGRIDEEEYVDYINAQFEIPLSQQQFFDGWNAIYQENLPGIEDLLVSLNKKYRVAALSNTNETHEAVWKDKYKDLFKNFEKIYTSHDLDAVKPEPLIYQKVINDTGVPAHKIIFLDDKEENIIGAKAMGMEGIVVSSPEAMYQGLQDLGIGF